MKRGECEFQSCGTIICRRCMDNGAVTVTGNNIGDIDKIFSAPLREKMLLQSHHYHTAL